ncbi:4-hydroxybenzoate octaprenyltransferase [Blochmannia endosymbiont of Polyrhachis (Hedomyrma) turneri]|uniref:4-hydroxybenzoate octaprenyltransferase n=1 Tax=Blochmannia endosymbiont of Polyrhachis (Hedomyrma) turneri TaxID=1505596 RepID=UPI001FE0ADFB|nr:4-hydroxybenzoate octaprenyltransferase [Blochmannia endosymbiont of Polyrhachis (Hedomyrma) turneri]
MKFVLNTLKNKFLVKFMTVFCTIYLFPWRGIFKLMRVDKPIGFFLLLWPTLWALWLSEEKIPNYYVLAMFIIGVFLVRSFGCVINDCVDKDIDCYVRRTSSRPLLSGMVSIQKALILFVVLLVISFVLLCLLDTSRQTILLSCITLLLVCMYPYTKRCIPCPQLFLGITFGCSILIVFSVIGVSLCSFLPWLLFLVNILWTIIYDTEYAMVDRDDDIFFSVQSSALLLGKYERFFIGGLQVVVLCLLIIVGLKTRIGLVFYFSLIGVAILFIWQQILMIGRNRDKCFQAFLSNHYVGMLIFLGIFLDLLFV